MSDSVRDILPSEDGVTLYICIGNSMRGDDYAGAYIAGMITETDRIKVCDAGEKPELGYDMALEIKPAKAVFIDAADMGLPAGTAQILYEDTLTERTMTTHKIPVPLISKLIREETGAKTVIIGIQPENVDFMAHMTSSVEESCRALAGMINGSK